MVWPRPLVTALGAGAASLALCQVVRVGIDAWGLQLRYWHWHWRCDWK